MFTQTRVLLALLAVSFLGLGGVAFAAPAFAAAGSGGNMGTSMTADRDGADSRSSTEAPSNTDPIAEKSSGTVTPIIMVTGLGLLMASIVMVVRSSSSRRAAPSD